MPKPWAMRGLVNGTTQRVRRAAEFMLGGDPTTLFKFRRVGRMPTFSKKAVSTLPGLQKAILKTRRYLNSEPYQFKSGQFGLRNYTRGTWAKYRPLHMDRVLGKMRGGVRRVGFYKQIQRRVSNLRRWGNQYGSGMLLHPKIYKRLPGFRRPAAGPLTLAGVLGAGSRNH